MSALPREIQRSPERFNYEGMKCPVCWRPKSLGLVQGMHECLSGCGATFKFIAGTQDSLPTLERVRAESASNAGSRIADDLRCLFCNARGYRHSCPTCDAANSREAGR